MTPAQPARVANPQTTPLEQQLVAEQVRAHYRQIPAMAIAPTLGGFFTVWVLWGAVDNRYLMAGMAAVTALSAARMLLYRRYFAAAAVQAAALHWRYLAVGAAALSGCLWGSAAPLLYPPVVADYDVFLLVLLTLLPIVPVAALAEYMPAFYAYYLPCMAPFIVTLALEPGRAPRMAALLLLMMMAAMLTFARRYSRSLSEAIRLRLQLSEKSDALERAVSHKSQFIAAASHDLRQPVHAMGMFLASLRRQGEGSEEARFVGYLDASLRNLRGMLTNMLDTSRLEADVVKVEPQDFAIGALTRKLADEYAPLALQKGLRFHHQTVDSMVHSDPVLLERILRNLLSNALKYTRHGGIALRARHNHGGVLLQVHDTGIGIARDRFDRIFQEFAQIDNAERADANGLGLGLAISRRMARLLGQTIGVHSVPGHGSVFDIALPAAGAVAPRPPAAEDRDAPAPPPMPPGLVLVIDDDEMVGASSAALVRRWGHRALVCPSAERALAALAESGDSPDLMIVDFRLAEGASGLQAAERVRQQLGWALPVILVTGDTAPARIREAFTAGHVLLHKPVDPNRLHACMIEVMLSARPRAASRQAAAATEESSTECASPRWARAAVEPARRPSR